jgi:hypothetical protein
VRTPSRFKGSLPKFEPVCGHSQTATPSRVGVPKQNDPRRREFEMEWFVKTINTTGGPVDVWAVDGVDEKHLVESPEGHSYLPRPIAAHLLTLWRSDCPPPDRS